MTLAAACLCWGASAEIVLPKVLGSNMVLQQQSEVNLWGKADADSKVTVEVSWSNDKIQTHSDAEGRWAVKVATPAASFDPQTITISDGESVTLENILIGDVWVCSGQSNMEMPVKGFGNQPVENSIDYIMRGGEEASRIRMFTVQRARSYDKDMEDCAGGQWECASPASVANCSATAYFFAYNLTHAVNIPIGIIATDWGGTRVEVVDAVVGIEGLRDRGAVQAEADGARHQAERALLCHDSPDTQLHGTRISVVSG